MLNFRFADIKDAKVYYFWANDPVSRENSYNRNEIKYSDHINWFKNKLNSGLCFFYLFLNEEKIPVGQVRIEKNEDKNVKEAIISLSVDSKFRGRGFGKEMVEIATDDFLNKHKEYKVLAYVFTNNLASAKCFLNAGYVLNDEKPVHNIPSYIFFKENLS